MAGFGGQPQQWAPWNVQGGRSCEICRGSGGESGGTRKPEICEPWGEGAEAWRVMVRSAPDWLGDLGKAT